MDSNSTTAPATELFAGEAWFDPIEAGLRDRVRGFIEEMVEQELAAALGRERYARSADSQSYRNGTRERQAIDGALGTSRSAAEDGGRAAILLRDAKRPTGSSRAPGVGCPGLGGK